MHDDEDGNATLTRFPPTTHKAVEPVVHNDAGNIADSSNSTQMSMSTNLLYTMMDPPMHAMSEMGPAASTVTPAAVNGRKLLQNPQIGGFVIINNPNLSKLPVILVNSDSQCYSQSLALLVWVSSRMSTLHATTNIHASCHDKPAHCMQLMCCHISKYQLVGVANNRSDSLTISYMLLLCIS